MKVQQIQTPATLVEESILKENIVEYQRLADQYHKKMYPMMKTHKSSYILQMQKECGAQGVLVGTIGEAEAANRIGFPNICMAYPTPDRETLIRISNIADNCNIILSIDSLEVAKICEDFFASKNQKISYLCIVNTGLNRFGVLPEHAGKLVQNITYYCPHLIFLGISTHPGQVYGETSLEGVKRVFAQEELALSLAQKDLQTKGYKSFEIHSGSTPTFVPEVQSPIIHVVRPGNYVFHDVIQKSLGICGWEKCALSILTTVISQRSENEYIVNCGSKMLGLDKGAHGNKSIVGYGHILGDDSGEVISLSEEVAIIKSQQQLHIGDKIRIIPNHSCSSANLTSFLYAVAGDEVIRIIPVDCRNNLRPIVE